MVKIKPFQAVRPNNYDVDKIASLPYDVVNVAEAKELVSNNPKSFLRVDRAEVDLADDVAVDDILRFESEMIEALRASHNELLTTIVDTKNLPDTDVLDATIEEFKATFAPSSAE